MSDFLALVEPYQRYIAYGLGTFVLVAVYLCMSDILRVVRYTLYKYGYQRGTGPIIPGPLEDTRLSRFLAGPRTAVEYRQKYGPVYRIFSGGVAEVVLSDPEAVRIHYQGDSKFHAKQESAGIGFHMEHILGKAVGFANGEDWTRVRSCVDPHFGLDLAFESIPSMFTDTAEWLNELPRASVTQRDEKNGRLIVPVEELIPGFPLKMVARIVFGDIMDDKFYSELYKMSLVHDRILNRIFFFNLQAYLPSKDNRDTLAFSKDWARVLVNASEECERRGISSPVYEFYRNVKAGNATFKEFAHTLDEILFGNITIMTSAITYAACHIAQNPDAQARLIQEIKDALKDESLGATPEDRRDSYVRKNNTFLHYCYLESARLEPVVAFTLPDVTHDAKVIHGYYIPPKTPVVIDTYNLHRTSPVWGSDGHSFRPDRFNGLPATQYRYAFWRFGIGPRKCVGLNFGDKIVKVILVSVFEKYALQLKDNSFVENDEIFFHYPKGTMILTPRDGGKI